MIGANGGYAPVHDAPAQGPLPCEHTVAPLLDALGGAAIIAFAVAGAAGSLTATGPGSGEDMGLIIVPPLLMLGAIDIGSAIYGSSRNRRCRMVDGREPVASFAIPSDSDFAALTVRAVAAADAGDCATVESLDAQICMTNRAFHDAFTRSPSLARCPALADATSRCATDRARRAEACAQGRMHVLEQMKATPDPELRSHLLAAAPHCEPADELQGLAGMMIRASAAAAAGNCAAVAALDTMVCQIDIPFHTKLFTRDPVIASCPDETGAAERCERTAADRREACARERMRVLEEAKQANEPEIRQRILETAPRCPP